MLTVCRRQESRLSLSLDRGSIVLVREHVLFRDQYHRTGRKSLNVSVRHSAPVSSQSFSQLSNVFVALLDTLSPDAIESVLLRRLSKYWTYFVLRISSKSTRLQTAIDGIKSQQEFQSRIFCSYFYYHIWRGNCSICRN